MLTRKLEPELLNFMLGKLKDNVAAKAAMEAKDFRQSMVYGVETLVGIKEKTGRNDGHMIELIEDTVGGPDHAPYCMSGGQTGLAFAEVVTGKKSKLIATELCTELWFHTLKNFPELRVKGIPLPGAFALWQDVRNGKKLSTGHMEIVRAAGNKTWYGIGFNTSGSSFPGGPVNREGNGVYYTTRDYENRATRHLLGFIKPI